jgi:AraC-like DNA-binding protein
MLKALIDIMSDKVKRTPFWKNVVIGKDDDCWNWVGDIEILTGFGVSTKLVSGSEVVRKAHRIAYILTFGTVPAGHVIRHKCRNQICCNPAHLIRMRTHPDEEDEYLVSAYYYNSKRASKLSDFEKRRIVTLKGEGFRVKDIASHFKVSTSTVSRVLKGAR